MNKRIFLSPPHMGGAERDFIDAAFESNYIAPVGENLTGFENDIKAYTGAKHALGVVSGTAAIHLALRVLGIGAGDRVAASSFTFMGSVSPITFAGAEPVFVDSDEKSWNIDPNLLEDCFKTRKPKALVLTHLYGQCADLQAIGDLCERYGVILIEDAAESLGATFEGRHTGTFGRMGIYSFNGNKIITTSGGGMLVSDDGALIKKAGFLSTQARDPFPHYEHTEIGYNYRLSNVLAGIGRGQMRVLADRVRRKREIFDFYKKTLSDLPIAFMPELSNSRGNRWLTAMTIETQKIQPETLRLALEAENIESRPLWKPMHLQPVFAKADRVVSGVGEALFAKGLCLPSGTAMGEADLGFVCDTIRKVF